MEGEVGRRKGVGGEREVEGKAGGREGKGKGGGEVEGRRVGVGGKKWTIIVPLK